MMAQEFIIHHLLWKSTDLWWWGWYNQSSLASTFDEVAKFRFSALLIYTVAKCVKSVLLVLISCFVEFAGLQDIVQVSLHVGSKKLLRIYMALVE